MQNEVASNITTNRRVFETSEVKIDHVPGGPWNAGNWVIGNTFEDLINVLKTQNLELIFKNKFLEILSKKHKEQNWVDIENEYYILLKDSFKNNTCNYKIEELNKDFKEIQELLEKYLKRAEDDFKKNFKIKMYDIHKIIENKIYSNFKFRDFTELVINKKVEEEFQIINKDLKAIDSGHIDIDDLSKKKQRLITAIGTNEPKNEIRKRLLYYYADDHFDLQPDNILFLSFNYTSTEDFYSRPAHYGYSIDVYKNQGIVIHIHGTNKNDGNNMIFGFGDEIDDDYKSIENLNDNNYLENIKSIKYLETDNYKKLLEFLNTDNYQIFIFGHSCGISDRTLLSTLFENKNCVSIKPFYHKRQDGTDNYSEIIRNITRNFSNKAVLRDKVVNKFYCEPLL